MTTKLRVASFSGGVTMLIPSAYAQAEGAPPPGGELFQIGFLIVLFGLFYFIAIRPQRKRQKEHAQMVAALNKGDEVITSSGMLGKIKSLDENYIVLSVSQNVELKFQRIHINAVLPKGTLKSVGIEDS
jgi:preprotein translocase subunit YajC